MGTRNSIQTQPSPSTRTLGLTTTVYVVLAALCWYAIAAITVRNTIDLIDPMQ